MAVGLGVLGYQRAQVQRVELQNRLSKDLSLDQRLVEVRQGVTKGIHQIDDLAESAVQFVETTLQPLEGRLPSSLTVVTTKAREQAREVRIQIRQRVARRLSNRTAHRDFSHRRRSPSVRLPRGQDVGERRRERDVRPPARHRPQPPRVAPEHRDVDRAHQLGIGLETEVGPRQLEQLCGHLGHGDVAARADVVDVPGGAVDDEEPIGRPPRRARR